MFTLRLALKNTIRAPIRSLLSIAAVVAGIVVMLLGTGFVSGTSENIVRSHIDNVTGHVTVRPEGYPSDPMDYPVDDLITVNNEAADWLDDNTYAWTSRVRFAPELIAGPRTSIRSGGSRMSANAAASCFRRGDSARIVWASIDRM